MKIYLLIIFTFFSVVQIAAQCTGENNNLKEKTMAERDVEFKNLPDDVKLDDQVRVNKYNEQGIIISFEVITVEKKLSEIGAKYIDGKLVDPDGREIRFYKPPIRGASEGFERDKEQAEIDAKELADLKEKFRVIEIFVNPLKFM